MIDVFGFEFRLYGFVLGLAILVGGWVAAKIAKRERIDPELVWDGLMWAAVGGVIGARLYHVIDLWDYYGRNLGQIVAVWNGGIGIFGGLVGGGIGLVLFVRKDQISNFQLLISNKLSKFQFSDKKTRGCLPLLKLLDIAAFGVPVGQAIGRWGNFFNQELYGPPTDLPWGIFIAPEKRLEGFEQFARFHPLFLYEGVLNLVLFGVLWKVYGFWSGGSDGERKMYKNSNSCTRRLRFRVGEGKFFGVYLIGYGSFRFLLEFLRLDVWRVGGVPMAQLVSVVMVVVGGWMVLTKVKLKVKSNLSRASALGRVGK